MTAVLDLACAADDRYAPHSAAMLHSFLAHADGAELRVHYLHGPGLSRTARDALRQMVEAARARISFLEIPDHRVAALPSMGRIPRTMWYRVFLPELAPSVDKVLYVDIDTMAVDSVLPLAELDLGDHYVAAVTNVFEEHELDWPERIGLPGPEAYFNSGVLVMNLDLMRRDHISDALLRCAHDRASELRWPDQDALNLVLGDRRLRLHPRWNCMHSVRRFEWAVDVIDERLLAEARESPGILHFEGPGINKPWHYLCAAQSRRAYREHRLATPWPDVRLEGVTPPNVIRRLLRREPQGLRRRGE